MFAERDLDDLIARVQTALTPGLSGVAIDFEDVRDLDSGQMGALLGLCVSCAKQGLHVAAFNVNERLATLFRLARVCPLDHLVRAGEADAIADAASRPAPPKPPGDR